MLGKNIFKHINSLDHEQIRTFLILNSAGYKRLIERFCKKNKIKYGQGYSKSADLSFQMINFIPREIIDTHNFLKNKESTSKKQEWHKELLFKDDFDLILDSLPIRKGILFRSICGYDEGRIIAIAGLPIYHASKTTPIIEEGKFIKISPHTTKTNWINIYDFAQGQFDAEQELSKSNKIKRPKKSVNSAKTIIKRYIDIENLLYENLYSDEFNQDDAYALFIKGIVETISQDLEIKFSTINSSYYDLLKKYNIPKLKQFEKIGFNT